jgi:hypothetical protein
VLPISECECIATLLIVTVPDTRLLLVVPFRFSFALTSVVTVSGVRMRT